MVYINGLSKITPFNTRKFAQNSACGLENAQNGKNCHRLTPKI